MTPKAQRRILNEAEKNLRGTAKGLKESMEPDNIPVHESVICKLFMAG